MTTSAKNYTQQYHETQAVINEFHEACQLGNSHGWAYEAGWLQSSYARVLMALPRRQRQEELAVLRQQARNIEHAHIIRTLRQD